MLKRRLRLSVARCAPAAAPGGIRVLLYHAIDDADPVDRMHLRVSRARFLEQMTALRDDGFYVVPLQAVSDPRERDDRVRVAITFDDGYRCQAWAAAALRDFGFPATFFVVPRFLDGQFVTTRYWENWGHLRWDQIAALTGDGFDIGAHSRTHPDLRTCSDGQLEDEVSGARALMEQRLGKAVRTFSYPYGRHDERVRRAVAHAGFELACTSRYGVNRGFGPPYAIHRTEVGGADDLSAFRSKLRGKFDWLGYWQDLSSWNQRGEPA